MRAGARQIRHLVGKRGAGLALIALAATCSLPAAAQAAELPPAAAQLGQTATATGAAALETAATAQGAVQQTAAEAVAPAQPVVERAAQTVTRAATPARSVVDSAARGVETAVAPAQPAAPVRPAAPAAPERPTAPSPVDREGGVRAPRPAPDGPSGQRSAPKRSDSAGGAGNAARGPVTAAQRVAAPTPNAGSATANPTSVDGGTSATHDLPAGAGSTASASSTSFSIGAYALLAAALLLAGPAIARRLRVDRAWFRPTLFVSVLERPG